MSSVWHVCGARAIIRHVATGKGTRSCLRLRSIVSPCSSLSVSSHFAAITTHATCRSYLPCLWKGMPIRDKRSFSKCSRLQMPRGRPRGGVVPEREGRQSEMGSSRQERRIPDEHRRPSAHVPLAGAGPEDIKEFLRAEIPTPLSDLPPEFPSDYQNLKMKQRKRDQTRGSYRPRIDPKDTSVLLFPGQGSQFVGMGQQVLPIPKVQEMYDLASDILGYDLLDLCLNGPKEKLNKTIYCQPAVFVASLAAVEKLKEENPSAIEHCIATAGFSVGEFAALVFAGSLSFEEGLEIVQQRAAAMQAASEDIPSGMMTAFLGPDNRAKMACHTAKMHCIKELGMFAEQVDCTIANFLYPECKVIAGNDEALDFIVKNSKEFGIRRTKRLAVSGAFHTRLMYPAQAVVAKSLEHATVKRPIINVHSNINAYKYTDAWKIRQLLARQVCAPVKWEQIQHKIFERRRDQEFPWSFECGPGRQLGGILKMTNMRAYNNYRPVEV